MELKNLGENLGFSYLFAGDFEKNETATLPVLPFLGEFPKSGVSGGKLGKEFGPLGIPQHAQILPQSWGILMKIGERKIVINPLLHVKFGQHFVVYSQ